MTHAETVALPCPICESVSTRFDVVDFNKSCEELRGKCLPLSGVPIQYYLCQKCGFCFAPEVYRWRLDEFASKIYNSEYVEVDPDYLDARPRANAQNLVNMFRDAPVSIRHLDYGGGNGLMSDLLFEAGWQSSSYDPFIDRDIQPTDLGKFDLITAYEVFEHVPDVKQLISNLSTLLIEDGIVLFSTLLSDGNIATHQRLTWWYASPRNGHISLFSRKSLAILAERGGFNFGSFSEGFHAFWRNVPTWAAHVIRAS